MIPHILLHHVRVHAPPHNVGFMCDARKNKQACLAVAAVVTAAGLTKEKYTGKKEIAITRRCDQINMGTRVL